MRLISSRDGMLGLPSGSGSLAMESSRRHRLNVSDWQAWCDNTHLEDIKRKAFETAYTPARTPKYR